MTRWLLGLAPWIALVSLARLEAAPPTPPRVEFTRMIAHWSDYADPSYLDFVSEAQPEVCQFGFYGGHFWSLAHTPQYKGYPAHFPVQGLGDCGDWFQRMNVELHQRGAKVVGHFNCKFLVGEIDGPEGPRGFFKFYRDLWDERELGPKPIVDPLEFLEKNADGTPIVNNSYSIGKMPEYWACLNHPAWRQVLKAWTKRAIERGVDGLIVNYFYRHNCLCPHCQRGFKEYLAERFSPAELKTLGIERLEGHVFPEIVGWHKPEESTPLRREMLRYSQLANKRAVDEVLIDYGRSLKPDLIVAQWNHLSNFSAISGDERCMLPADVWGRGEDYLWYSSGAYAHYSDLQSGFLGDVTLQCRYIRGAFDDKPYTIGKYEQTRTRMAIAELAANGGAPMGFYTRFKDPAARQEISRYFGFMKRNDAIYRANRPQAEVLLLHPRQAIHAGNLVPLQQFRDLGKSLLERHVLFDVKPDDIATSEIRAAYRHVVDPTTTAQLDLDAWKDVSRFSMPTTVRVGMTQPAEGGQWTLHVVNYDRDEPEKPKSAGTGIVDEKPRAVRQLGCEIILPADRTIRRVRYSTPEQPEPVDVPFQVRDGRLRCELPETLVYGIAQIEWAP